MITSFIVRNSHYCTSQDEYWSPLEMWYAEHLRRFGSKKGKKLAYYCNCIKSHTNIIYFHMQAAFIDHFHKFHLPDIKITARRMIFNFGLANIIISVAFANIIRNKNIRRQNLMPCLQSFFTRNFSCFILKYSPTSNLFN